MKNEKTESSLGKVKDWHYPNNAECRHNADVYEDCTCKRIVNRKPYRRIRVHDEKVPHGYRHDIIVEVWPNGLIKLRERGRREKSAHGVMAGDLYSTLVRRHALAIVAAKRKARAEKRKARRKGVK